MPVPTALAIPLSKSTNRGMFRVARAATAREETRTMEEKERCLLDIVLEAALDAEEQNRCNESLLVDDSSCNRRRCLCSLMDSIQPSMITPFILFLLVVVGWRLACFEKLARHAAIIGRINE